MTFFSLLSEVENNDSPFSRRLAFEKVAGLRLENAREWFRIPQLVRPSLYKLPVNGSPVDGLFTIV